MTAQLLKKSKLKDLLISVSSVWETYIPLKDFAGEVQFVNLQEKHKQSLQDKLNLDYQFLVIPPKVLGFPQIESLFESQDGRITETTQVRKKRLLFGLRACDVKGMLFMDDLFSRNFEDIYYLNRSMDKFLVIVGCQHPLESCFCTSTKSGPFLPIPEKTDKGKYNYFDLQLADLGDEYLVEIGSKRGEEFIRDYQIYFEQASQEDIKRLGVVKRKTEAAVKLKLDFNKAIDKFCQDKVAKETYERIAERCIYCGGCVYVCPTCNCFNLFDEQKGSFAKRYRNWDTCVFEGYTREASGYNPRFEKWMRTSRRYEHKLKYDYLVNGMSGCVGCGRCLLSCPVNIGISRIIQEVTQD
ncbi:MAG: 4Fe-4S dicluster domain-containing protein [Candidatus Omnitrophota bacterium]|jgi:ferredoxin